MSARICLVVYRLAASAAVSGLALAMLLVFAPPACAQGDESGPTDTPAPPAEVRPDGGGPIRILAGLSTSTFVLLQGVDIAQTMQCVGAARCHEVNPFLQSLAHNPTAFGATKMAIAFASGYALFHERERHPKLVLVLSIAGTGLYGTITYRQAKFGR